MDYCNGLHGLSGSLIPNGHRLVLAGGQDILRIHCQLNHGSGVRAILPNRFISRSRIEHEYGPAVRASRKDGPLWTRRHAQERTRHAPEIFDVNGK